MNTVVLQINCLGKEATEIPQTCIKIKQQETLAQSLLGKQTPHWALMEAFWS